MTKELKRYLGDAVMATYDGYQICLRTEDGNNNVIYLEPEVITRLVEFILDCQREVSGKSAND